MTPIIPKTIEEKITRSLSRVMTYAMEKDYAGYSKFDAMNSPFLEKFLGWHPILRLITIQAVNRVPLNLRRFFGVQKSRNPKGIANFIKAWSNLYMMDPREETGSEIDALAAWLMAHHANGKGEFRGICWGYNFPWQNPGFYAPRFFPNAIVTVFCAEAFLKAHMALGKNEYLDTAVNAARYLMEDLPVLEADGTRKCVGYVTAPLKLKVVNINAVIAGFLARLSSLTGEKRYLDEAEKLINWTVAAKTDYHAWYYTHPPTAYVRNHDNYHTGGILDGIYDHLTLSKDPGHFLTYMRGITFYERELFDPSGAPKWRNKSSFPYDIHGSAQGILSFTKAASFNRAFLDRALRVALWAIENMQAPDGRFYYQKHRLFLWKLDLMRWNNSWMAWALSELLTHLHANR